MPNIEAAVPTRPIRPSPPPSPPISPPLCPPGAGILLAGPGISSSESVSSAFSLPPPELRHLLAVDAPPLPLAPGSSKSAHDKSAPPATFLSRCPVLALAAFAAAAADELAAAHMKADPTSAVVRSKYGLDEPPRLFHRWCSLMRVGCRRSLLRSMVSTHVPRPVTPHL